MRTKTLLLTAALSAAGVATSMAQTAVYSVNAVGYVNTTLTAGQYNLISNPLEAADNSIAALFADLPVGSQVFKYDNGAYVTATKDEFTGEFLPTSAAQTQVVPGEGVFVLLPAGTDQTVTFVGEVRQGSLSTPLPAGLSIRSSEVPQTGTADELEFPASPGDQIFKFDPATGYTTYSFDEFSSAWLPSVPTIEVGEAVFVNKIAAANWTRNFNINE